MEKDEINKLIHEKVMGECWHVLPEYSDDVLAECVKCAVKIKRGYENPTYLNNIADAWKVAEKLQEKGFWWSAVGNSRHYVFKFCATTGEYPEFADTLGEAICLSALSAVGV